MPVEKEIWVPIPSDMELEASSCGRIRIIGWKKAMPNGGSRVYGTQPTFGQWDGVRLIYSRKGHKTRKVARLICEAFHGPAPFSGAVAMHLDENSRNNKPGNLKWATQKENLNSPKFLEYCSKNCRTKVSGQKVI